MKHIVSWSGGKDSTATIILAHEHGLPIDLIIIALVWFDRKRGIYGEHPEHIKWIFEYAIPMFESWGYKVEVVSSERDYVGYFYHEIRKSKYEDRVGKYAGWLLSGHCRMNREKVTPIQRRLKSIGEEFTEYIGIAIDEPERLERMKAKKNKISLLAKYGFTEEMARKKCKDYGLLSPTYDITHRGGCWFCPNQRISELAFTKINHPELWEELVKFSNEPNKTSENFSHNKTFVEIANKVDEYIEWQSRAPVQMSIFDAIEEGVNNND